MSLEILIVRKELLVIPEHFSENNTSDMALFKRYVFGLLGSE